MRQFLLTIVAIILLALPCSAWALSNLGEDFLRVCWLTDAVFPPDDWSRDDLRAAALEVLDECESGAMDTWPVHFCLITLGHTQYPEDLERILAYEEDRPRTVIRALRGFPDPMAIEILLEWAASDAAERELAYHALDAIDFGTMDEGEHWRNVVLDELREILTQEPVAYLKDTLTEVIGEIESQQGST